MRRAGRAEVVTFGCRINAAEAEVIRRHAEAAGGPAPVVVNTCAVTSEAVAQARQAIRAARRARPDARIVATGCAAQADPASFASMPEVDHVIGNEEKLHAATWAGIAAASRVLAGDIMAVREMTPHAFDSMEGHVRAFVQVQNGCDHRCTFCIIPYGRGNSRSLPPDEAVAQVRRLVESGYREVVLTGVDITSYASGLGALVRRILDEIPELRRLRLSSIDSVEADRELLDAFAGDARLMPHLHLSLQAGDDLVLKRMKRRHSRAQAIDFCRRLRALRPDVVFGADIIAGFPTEDEAMFARSLDLVEECGLTHLHVFPFSPRPGTPAARMPQIAGPVVRERAARLRARAGEALARHLDAQVGALVTVLAERGGAGRTPHFTPVRLAPDVAPGSFLEVAVSGHDGRRLLAA